MKLILERWQQEVTKVCLLVAPYLSVSPHVNTREPKKEKLLLIFDINED